MAESAAIGIKPHEFWRYTPRELFAAFVGANLAAVRDRQRALWAAWMNANFQRAKKLPALMPLLKSLEQKRDMTDKELRTTIFGMARAMGAKITYKKRGDP